MFLTRFLPTSRLRRFGRDTKGTAGLEFAMITPLALVMSLGAIEYSRAVLISRRFNLVTATLSDLIARDTVENPQTMQGLQHAAETIWSPFDKTSLVFQILDVRQGATGGKKAGQNYVYWPWTMTLDGSSGVSQTYAQCANYAGLPANMLSPGSSTIVVNASYTFKTLFGATIVGLPNPTQSWTSSSTHSPRNLCVGWVANNCSTPCE